MYLQLSSEGATDYVISYADDAILPEITAARELSRYLRLATGAAFPVLSESGVPADGTRQIAVGHSRVFLGAASADLLQSLEDDTIYIAGKDGHLILAGGRPRGTIYAVYTFLEEVVGVRWWTFHDIEIPAAADLSWPVAELLYTPAIKIRDVWGKSLVSKRGHFFSFFTEDELPLLTGVNDHGIELGECQFAVINKVNGFDMNVSGKFGGDYHLLGSCHTFNLILPPADYFGEHPEWFMEIFGGRHAHQPCLSNTSMKEQFIENTLKWIRRHPGIRYVSVSQNDYPYYCECAECSRRIGELGSATDLLLAFLNDVAEAVEREFPGVTVETLAYQWTRKPPVSVKPRSNVLIRLSNIEVSQNHPIDDEVNRHFFDDLLGWSKVADRIYIYSYVFNAHNLSIPHPYAYGTPDILQKYLDNNVIGVFLQGDAFNYRSNFNELKSWVYPKLLWNPKRDEQALIDEFIQGYYREAAPYIRQYWRLLHDRMKRSREYYGCFFRSLDSYYDAYSSVLPQITTASWLEPEDLAEALGLFERAKRSVLDDPRLLPRVEGCFISLQAVWLQDYDSLKLLSAQRGTPFPGPPDVADAVDRFAATAASLVSNYNLESVKFTNRYADLLKKRLVRSVPSAEGDGTLELQGDAFASDTSGRVHGSPSVLLEPDGAAASGFAAVIDTDAEPDDRLLALIHHCSWFYYYKAEGLWEIRLEIRCDCRAEAGDAFAMELVDIKNRRTVARIVESCERLRTGEYRAYSLGRHELRDGMFVRVSVAERRNVARICLDRMLLTLHRP